MVLIDAWITGLWDLRNMYLARYWQEILRSWAV